MRPSIVISWVVALVIFCLGSTGRAEVRIQEIRWQVAQASRRPPTRYRDISEWVQPPSAKALLKLRPVVKIFNHGGQPVSGLVLRYAVSAKLAPLKGPAEMSVWTVPFWMEERRIPRLGRDRLKEIRLHKLKMLPFLERMRKSGYWPRAVKIQVMLEPKKGQSLKHKIMESVLPIRWKK